MKNSIVHYLFMREEGLYNDIGQSEEHMKLSEDLYAVYKQFKASLTSEQDEQFEKYVGISVEMESDTMDYYFSAGLKIGMRLAFECFDGQVNKNGE